MSIIIIDKNSTDPERTENIKLLLNVIPKWWQESLFDEPLNVIEILEQGVNCIFLLNNNYVLKVLKPKYNWSKTNVGNKNQSIIDNYNLISESNFTSTPKIVASGFSETLSGFFIATEYTQSDNLFNLYYLADSRTKKLYIQKFINLTKDFHGKLPGHIHEDLHFGNILVDKKGQMLLVDFDNMKKSEVFNELRGLMQGLLLPSCCVSEELEQYYLEPLLDELKIIVTEYQELLPRERIEDAKAIFKNCFDKKLNHPKFKDILEPLYQKIIKENLLESL